MERAADVQLPPLAGALREAVATALGDGGTLAPTANPALVFDRYPRTWESRLGAWDLGLGRKTFLQAFVKDYARLGREHLPLVDDRRRALDTALGAGRDFTAQWRFVSGLGADHPLENGFTFHRLLGVPSLPGSTVKGLTRAAAKVFGIEGADEERIFGPALAPGVRARSGALVFGEALPVRWPALGVDLVNNHHPTWTAWLGRPDGKEGSGRLKAATAASGAGLEDPVPVYFLVVEPGATFRFWIAERPGGGARDGDLARAWQWLEAGLHYLGIGAKTAVGYGRFGSGHVDPSDGERPGPDKPPPTTPQSRRELPKSGATVEAVLLEERTKKGGWRARHTGTDIEGHIVNWTEMPADLSAGAVVHLIVASATESVIAFRYPTKKT